MTRKRKTGSQSAGYHADLSIPGYEPETPTVAPPPSEAAKGPAGDYAGAEKDYEAAVEALPAAAQAVTEAATSKARAESAAKRTRRRAATRQQHLVSRFITKAYDQKIGKIKGGDVPAWDVGRRVEKAKNEVEDLRQRLLSHPAVEDANSKGKVVPPKGLAKLHQREEQYHALEGPQGISRSKQLGLEARSLRVGPKGTELLASKEPNEGDVGHRLARGEAGAHARSEPSTLEALSYASLGIPVGGVGSGAAKLAEVGAETLPKLLAEGGARQVAKEAGASIASKGRSIASIPGKAAAAGKAAPQAIKELPAVLRVGAKEAPTALKGAAKATPRYAGKAGLKGAERSYQAFGGAAVLGATHKAGLDLPGGALLEGQGKALKHDPGQVLSSTANLAPSLLVSAFQLPVAAGASAVTGSTKPLEGAVNEQFDFFKHFADTYGSSDAKEIEQATLEEGLLPEILVGPLAAKGIEKLSGPARGRARGAFEGRRAPATDDEGNVLTHEHGGAVKRGTQRSPSESKQPITRLGEHNVHRREEAFHASTTNDTIQLEHARRREGIDKHARKAHGEKTVVREGLGPKGKDTLHQRPPDYIPFLNRAGIDLHNPDAALREIQHYAEKFKGLDHPSKYGVNPEALTARDAVKFFTDHPEALKDKHLASALDEFRSMQNGEKGLRSLSTSDRNRYLAHAVMHDIPDAVDRVPMGAREHTDATTREGAWEDLKGRTKQVKDLRKEGRKKYDQAQEASPERAAKLRSEAKAIYEKARAVDKGRRELHDELKNFTRPGAKANPSAKRIAYDEALEKEFVDEARASLKAKGLHPEPAYTPDTDAINRATPDQTATGGPKPLPGGAKINEGYNWRHGLTRQGYEHMMNEGILRQVARNHQFENARRFRADRGIQFEGEFQHTGKGWAKAFDQGAMNRRDVALVPTQVVNRLEKATQGGDPTEYEAALAEMQAARKVDPKDAQSGTIYEAYPKAAYDEWVQQAQKTNVPKALRQANRFTSMNMLSTPAFVGAQVVAETAQAIAEVNPARMIQGLHAYNKLTPEQKLRISGASGETAKAIFSPEELQTTLGSYNEKPFTDALGFFRRNVLGRSAKSFVTLHAAGEIDRLKGSYIRRGTLTGQVMRDLNGTWAKGRKLLKLQTAIQKQIGHLKPHEQLAWIAEHPKVLDRYQKDLHAAMGGWGNLTRTGKVPEQWRSALLVFYPYLRMSIQWPLKYAMRHPIKATALAYLAAENNFALKEALEGDPSFLNYAQIPVYVPGPNGKPVPGDPINLSRIAPGGNALTTAVQGSGSLLGALQPVLAAGIEGATGKGPLGAVEGGFPEHVKAGIAGILGLSPYVRAADTLKGQKDSGQSEYGVLGKRANIALNPLAALSSKLKGSKGEQLTRSLAFPFLPQNIDHQRDYAKLGRILTKLGDTGSSAQAKLQATKGTASEQRAVRAKVEAMQSESAKAEKQLEAMYAKYGLSKVAARSLDVYKYTHPYPEEEKKGPYEGSGYGGSGYEGTGYGGGGNKEKPVPVPQQTDGVGFNLPGLGGALGAIANPLASLIGGEKASAAGFPKGHKQITLTGPLSAGEKTFAETVAKETPLKPETVAAWTLQEGGNSTGDYNRLNIGHTDSGALGLTEDPRWKNPVAAGKLTAEFLKGRFGGASEGIQAILPAAKGKSAAQQLQVIAGSGWATDPNYASNLQGALGSVGANRGDLQVGKNRKVYVRADAKGMVQWAHALLGTQEGSKLQQKWAAQSGVSSQEPWCSEFIAAGLARRGLPEPANPAYSGTWLTWKGGQHIGTDLTKAKPGDVVVFGSNPGATTHVGLYVGSGKMISGNWSDEVAAANVSDDSEPIAGIIRPKYKGGKVAVKAGIPLPGSAIAPSGELVSAPVDAPFPEARPEEQHGKKRSRNQTLTGAQRLKLVNEISAGNLEGLGIPGYTPKVGPAVADLAALGESLEDQRRKLARL